MIRYLLVRHATAASAIPGAELTPRGRAEAEALARRLGSWPFDAAWSSDLPRAVRTARILLSGRGSPPLQTSAALREVEAPWGSEHPVDSLAYAAWEREAVTGLTEGLSEWLGLSTLPAVETAGNPNEVRLRGLLELPAGAGGLCLGSRRLQSPGATTVLVVSHAGPLRVLICLLLGLPPQAHWSFRLDPASLTIVDRGEDMGTITLLNDRCHLESMSVTVP